MEFTWYPAEHELAVIFAVGKAKYTTYGLARMLNIHYNTLTRYMKGRLPIGEQLRERIIARAKEIRLLSCYSNEAHDSIESQAEPASEPKEE